MWPVRADPLRGESRKKEKKKKKVVLPTCELDSVTCNLNCGELLKARPSKWHFFQRWRRSCEADDDKNQHSKDKLNDMCVVATGGEYFLPCVKKRCTVLVRLWRQSPFF